MLVSHHPNSHRSLLLLVLAVVAALATLVAAENRQAPPPVGSADVVLQPPGYPFRFVVYGDSRFTDPGDTKHSNAQVRRAEIARIVQERPWFVALTGDLVLKGDEGRDWRVFDQETEPLRSAGIRVFPAVGNHDVRGGRAEALANYFQRFPDLKQRTWYSVRAGNVLLLVLDSTLNDGPGSPQWQWVESWLEVLPADIDFVLLTMHHPPYTRSTDHMMGGGHAARAPEQELGRMLEARQARMRARILVFSGHVHNYERYLHGGVMYVVSGGGGATPYMVERLPGDFYRDHGTSYHICNLTVERGRLRFQMLKLEPGENPQWSVRDSFELTAP